MEVEQKHVTTIRLHDAKGGEVALQKDGKDYQLKLCSSDTTVIIVLGHSDIRKLCQQIVQLDIQENWKPKYAHPPEVNSFFAASNLRSIQETMCDWVATMARDSYEKSTNGN